MTRYKALAITTRYWKPGQDYLEEITSRIKEKIADGDFIVISEKSISTAIGNITDENTIKPSQSARFIAKYWMRVVWARFLGRLCHFQERLLKRLHEYPLEKGSAHKQLTLQRSGLLQALMFGSEGGIDGSNLAYSYVCLPLYEASIIAQRIRMRILTELRKDVSVIIVDTDKTYSIRNFHFTPRPRPVKGIQSIGGVISFVIGRMLKLRKRATPIAISGREISTEDALEIAKIADHARGFGAGRTVWDVAEKYGVDLDKVSWEMLMTAKHKPIVIARSKR